MTDMIRMSEVQNQKEQNKKGEMMVVTKALLFGAANDRKAWNCIRIRNFKHTYLVNSSISTSDLWNFRFYSPSSKDNDLQTPGWNLSCVYFHICGSKSIWINFFLNTGCMPK